MTTYTRSEILEKYLLLKNSLQRIPFRYELCKEIPRYQIDKFFGSFELMLVEICDKVILVPEIRNCIGCSKSISTYSGNKTKRYCSKGCANTVLKLRHGRYKLSLWETNEFGDKVFTVKHPCGYCAKDTPATSAFCDRKCRLLSANASKTIGDTLNPNDRMASKYSPVRCNARAVSRHFHKPCCMKCGYDKHFEVCHIKPISSFSTTDLLSVVNAPENLMHLCPNCHWEFDKHESKG